MNQTNANYLLACNLIDIEAREVFTIRKCARALIKCYCRFNYYSKRDREINQGIISAKCLRYSSIEI